MVMADIYAINGDYDRALDEIEYVLSIPYVVTVGLLRTEPKYPIPEWKALSEQPRFQQILAKGQLVL